MTSPDTVDRDTVKALGHPLRLRILETIIDHGEGSPAGLARQLQQPLSTVSRHFRLLRDLGFLEMTRTEPRRGAVEHFYRCTRPAFVGDSEWDRLPAALRRSVAGRAFRRVFAEASAAGGDGGFDASDAHLDRLPLALDELGRAELSRALLELIRKADLIQRRCDARRRGRHADRASVESTTLALMHFRSASRGKPADGIHEKGDAALDMLTSASGSGA